MHVPAVNPSTLAHSLQHQYTNIMHTRLPKAPILRGPYNVAPMPVACTYRPHTRWAGQPISQPLSSSRLQTHKHCPMMQWRKQTRARHQYSVQLRAATVQVPDRCALGQPANSATNSPPVRQLRHPYSNRDISTMSTAALEHSPTHASRLKPPIRVSTT